MQGFQHADELAAKPIFEAKAISTDASRQHGHFFVLDVHALDSADALWELEDLRLAEWLGGVETARRLPDGWRVQALFDGGPD